MIPHFVYSSLNQIMFNKSHASSSRFSSKFSIEVRSKCCTSIYMCNKLETRPREARGTEAGIDEHLRIENIRKFPLLLNTTDIWLLNNMGVNGFITEAGVPFHKDPRPCNLDHATPMILEKKVHSTFVPKKLHDRMYNRDFKVHLQ